MPIFEYYCPDNHRIYQFFARTLAQGQSIPKCPDNPLFRMEKLLSSFAIGGPPGKSGDGTESLPAVADDGAGSHEDARMEAAIGSMEQEFSSIDEKDPRAMGRMMRRMAELSGEKIDGEMEELVRRLEEGEDPDKLEERLGDSLGDDADGGEDPSGMGPPSDDAMARDPKEPRHRYKVRRGLPSRDPNLYDYE